jgi:hypothetical protein
VDGFQPAPDYLVLPPLYAYLYLQPLQLSFSLPRMRLPYPNTPNNLCSIITPGHLT